MAKRVIIACGKEKPAAMLKRQFEAFFDSGVEFETLIVDSDFHTLVGCDLVVASSKKIANQMAKFLMEDTNIIVLRMTIRHSMYETLVSLPLNEKILVVNNDFEMTQETIFLLYEIGLKHVELVPYYPGCPELYEEIELAITPNEETYVPKHVKKVINIGDRAVDSSTYIDVLMKLNMQNRITVEKIFEYTRQIIPISEGLAGFAGYEHGYEFNVNQVLEALTIAAAILDHKGRVVLSNKAAKECLGKYAGESLIGMMKQWGDEGEWDTGEERLAELGKREYFISFHHFGSGAEGGGILFLEKAERIKNMHTSYQNHKKGKSGILKYDFRSIIGGSLKIRSMKELAARFAATEYPILIQGESGTGKEMLAQAVHQASKRRRGPFVAFNCAALTDSLLESELFGYEGGAFTGASRHGRTGIFEAANGGTLFLDEIGDISLNMQSKLLRVLQEREIIKVGGTRPIPVDLRIISATNKRLIDLVEGEKFRLDLYYRLNTLLLETVPLRERPEDIPALLSHFFKQEKIKKDIEKEALEALEHYSWPGNVRELENCVYYLSIVESDIIREKDLPHFILEKAEKNTKILVKKTVDSDQILLLLWKCKKEGQKIGRAGIVKELNGEGIYITENELRCLLLDLKEKGLVEMNKGRGGSRLTQKGSFRAMQLMET